jgi:two-component system chemotaxis sensor kinase CheA
VSSQGRLNAEELTDGHLAPLTVNKKAINMLSSYFESMSLARRLSLGFISVLVLLLAVAITSSYALKLQGDRVQRIVQVNNVKTAMASQLMDQINNLGIRARSAALFTDMDHKALELEFTAAQSAEKSFLKTEAALSAMVAGANGSDQERALMAEIFEAGKKLLPETTDALEKAMDADVVASTMTLSNRVRPAEAALRDKVTELMDLQANINQEASNDVLSLQRKVFSTVGILVLVALLGGILIAWRITKSVTGPVTGMQTTMTEIATSQDFSRRVPVDRMDEIGLSIVAFNAMIGKIQESSIQLKQKTADIQAMMHYIPQGVLTVQGGNKVHPEFSAYLQTILETQDIAGRDVMDLIFANSQCNAEIQSQVEAVVAASIGEDAMNFEFNEHLLVREVTNTMPDGRVKILDLSWSPITDDMDAVVRIMLCVRDVTEIKKLAAEAGAQKRELVIIGQILAINQEKFHEFVDSSYKFLSENKQLIDGVGKDVVGATDPEVINLLFRNMHTIKGNARTYGLLHLTNIVHEAEKTYDSLRKEPDAAWDHEHLQGQLASAFAAIKEYEHINETKLGRKGPGRRGGVDKFLMVQIDHIQQATGILDHVDWSDIASVRDAVARVHNCLAMIGTENIESILAGVSGSLPSLAKELGKEVPTSTIQDHGIVIKNQVADLVRNVFMHLYRNSMDHGIESPAERLASGKIPAGRIQLELFLNGDQLQFKLCDDGRGLAVDLIRKKAIEKGLITKDQHLSPEQVAQLIFQPGFSTAEQVTEVSGRGVGMDAVKSFVEREGGSIELCFPSPEALGSGDGYRPFETVIKLPAKLAVRDTSRSA